MDTCNSGIYQIRNVTTGLCYIGSSVSLVQRKLTHFNHLRKNKHANIYLQRAWNKYSESAFLFEIIEYVPSLLKLIEREQYYLDTLHPFAEIGQGYNISHYADSSLGTRRTKEQKYNISQSRLGHKLTLEHRKKISESLKRVPHTCEWNSKMRKAKQLQGEKHRYIGQCLFCTKTISRQISLIPNTQKMFCDNACQRLYQKNNCTLSKQCPECQRAFTGPRWKILKKSYCNQDCFTRARKKKNHPVFCTASTNNRNTRIKYFRY